MSGCAASSASPPATVSACSTCMPPASPPRISATAWRMRGWSLTMRILAAANAVDAPAVPRFGPGNTLSMGFMLASGFLPSIAWIDMAAA